MLQERAPRPVPVIKNPPNSKRPLQYANEPTFHGLIEREEVVLYYFMAFPPFLGRLSVEKGRRRVLLGEGVATVGECLHPVHVVRREGHELQGGGGERTGTPSISAVLRRDTLRGREEVREHRVPGGRRTHLHVHGQARLGVHQTDGR